MGYIVIMSELYEALRSELRGLDGDLYLSHLFVPAINRDRILTLYRAYADIARIGNNVSESMIGQIRFQWWRDLLAQIEAGNSAQTPIGEAIAAQKLNHDLLRAIIDGFELGMIEPESAQKAAAMSGRALITAALEICSLTADMALIEAAGVGFELLRQSQNDTQIEAAYAHLKKAARAFNGLKRKTRLALIPVLMPVGLAHKQAQNNPRQRSLFYYQIQLLKMSVIAKI